MTDSATGATEPFFTKTRVVIIAVIVAVLGLLTTYAVSLQDDQTPVTPEVLVTPEVPVVPEAPVTPEVPVVPVTTETAPALAEPGAVLPTP